MPTGDYSKTKAFKKKISIQSQELWDDPNSVFYSKEYRNKLSVSKSGENHYMFGKHHSEEAKEKRKTAMLGKKNHFYGKKHTKESNLKNSIAAKKRWADPNSKYNTKEYKLNRKEVMKYATTFIKFDDTEIEKIIKQILEKNNIQFETQKYFDEYRVDFFIPQYKLIIEADGQWSHGDPRIYGPDDIIQGHKIAKEKWAYDKNRDTFLESLGYKVIRFWEKEIKKETDSIENIIKKVIFEFKG